MKSMVFSLQYKQFEIEKNENGFIDNISNLHVHVQRNLQKKREQKWG